MTICIAAICEDYIIIGASDRMVVCADGLIATSPNVSKSGGFNYGENDSIAIMIAGNVDYQYEIINNAARIVGKGKTEERLTVDEVLDAYTSAYQAFYFRQAESAVLTPLLVTRKQYESGQLDESLHKLAAEQLSAFARSFKENEENSISTIIAGFDNDGPHLFKLHFDEVSDMTGAGYVAIGSGSWHADSHFQLNYYSKQWSYSDAMLLLYEAKVKAQLDTSVDDKTDMFKLLPLPLGPELPTFQRLGPFQVGRIAVAYDDMMKEVREKEKAIKLRLSNELQDPIIDDAKEAYENWARAQTKSNGTEPDKTAV